MYFHWLKWKSFSVVMIFFCLSLIILLNQNSMGTKEKLQSMICLQPPKEYSSEKDFEGFDNETGTEDGRYIIPNYVHFIRFGLKKFTFIDAVCVLAAFKNQKPEKLFIHHDFPLEGKYWDVVIGTEGFSNVLVLKNLSAPNEIFNQKVNPGWKGWHGSDIERLRTLQRYGGIYLDNDSYIVRSFNDLRRYELVIGWMENWYIMNQIIVAHKNARFLKLWLESYRIYNASLWYYNAGHKPTEEILKYKPYVVHREKYLLTNDRLWKKLYLENWKEWRSHYGFHLTIHHQYLLGGNKSVAPNARYPVDFNETNIKLYKAASIADMIYDVYPIPK